MSIRGDGNGGDTTVPGTCIILPLPHTQPHSHLAMATLVHIIPSVPRDSPDGPGAPRTALGSPSGVMQDLQHLPGQVLNLNRAVMHTADAVHRADCCRARC